MLKFYQVISLLMFCSNISALQVNDEVPVCNAKLEGLEEVLDLNQYKNKVLLIDFWATWCPPCMQSMPFLNTLRNEFKEQGFEILAINVDEDIFAAKDFLIKYPVDYPVVFDSSGDCPTKYDVKAMPSSYFVDQSGKVRVIHLGFRSADEDEIRTIVLKLLKEGKNELSQ